jgi:hypothetical protein
MPVAKCLAKWLELTASSVLDQGPPSAGPDDARIFGKDIWHGYLTSLERFEPTGRAIRTVHSDQNYRQDVHHYQWVKPDLFSSFDFT